MVSGPVAKVTASSGVRPSPLPTLSEAAGTTSATRIPSLPQPVTEVHSISDRLVRGSTRASA